MKTDDLISVLATGVEAVEPHQAERRYAKAIAAGMAGAGVLMLVLLQVRADLAEAVRLPMFWVKFGFVGSLLLAGMFASMRFSRPGARVTSVPLFVLLPIVAMWVLAAVVLFSVEADQRMALVLGETWNSCPLLIAMLSLPVFVAVIWAMKGLAPTQPRQAGFAAGLLSGATAALVYCFHCPESAAPFIGLWYTLGIFIS
ncbi:MAG: DUF1109 domain-containing protein, partial [Betaproteobacteria bacterium]